MGDTNVDAESDLYEFDYEDVPAIAFTYDFCSDDEELLDEGPDSRGVQSSTTGGES